MRLRVGLLLCFFATLAALGCRKALAPNVDRNKAPETWITAAPFDTITLQKGQRPLPGTIPVRFHLYWAGSDQDGAVVGFYWAVVETLPLPPEGGTSLPPLPGPKARDYRYTTKTDSVFIFTVAEDIPDRQHAFYIYAVDDQGKPDPTPARFIFNALDRFPPLPVFDEASATGTVYTLENGVLRSATLTYAIRDSLNFNTLPSDTVPSGSRVRFRFRGESTVSGNLVKGFRFKLEEAALQPTDPASLYGKNIVEYNVPASEIDPACRGRESEPECLGKSSLPLAPGTKVFTLRAVDQANGSRDATRRFQLNFSPDTWFWGPDPNVVAPPAPPQATPGVWYSKPNGEKFALLNVRGELPAAGLPGSLLGPDSVRVFPADRWPPRRTFLEIYRDSVFIRREFDFVHMSSWVIFHNGGFDKDSPYQVKVADGVAGIMPGFPPEPRPVLEKRPQNGSPIGFRSLVTNWQTPNGPLASTAESRLYPYFDPNDVLHFARIGAYHPMFLSGTAYALQRAVDGDGDADRRVDNARRIREFPRNANERKLGEAQVLVFHVNFPPELQTRNPFFRPRVGVVDTFTSRFWDLSLPGDDPDPYVSGDRVGGPSAGKTLRYRFTVTGNGLAEPFKDPPPGAVQQKYINPSFPLILTVPPNLATGPATLTVELCDCSFCELNSGTGRCITRDIEVYYVAPSSASTPP